MVGSDPLYTYFTLDHREVSLCRRLFQKHQSFKELIEGEIQRGVSPDLSEAFIVTADVARQEGIEPEVLRPCVLGKHISRYGDLRSDTLLIYLTRVDDIRKYPHTKKHLEKYRHKITCKEVEEGKHPWYTLHRPRDPGIFRSPKFIGLTTTKTICVALDNRNSWYATDALYLFKVKENVTLDSRFVLGILHSKCFQFLYHINSQGEQRIIPQIKAARLYDLPFPRYEISDSHDEQRHGRMVVLVERMLSLHKQLVDGKTDHERTVLQRQMDTTDQQIDQLVYELYELTEEEIKIIEKT